MDVLSHTIGDINEKFNYNKFSHHTDGLGRIWATGYVLKEKTGCVKCWLAMLTIQSFTFWPHLQPNY